MKHTEHAYIEAGYKCARARLQSDERLEGRRLFDQGYSEAQPTRKNTP